MKNSLILNSPGFVFAVFLILTSCDGHQKQEMTAIRYASVRAIVEAPAHVAFKNGYFEDEGLDLKLEINPDGKTSLDRLLMDSVDIASVMATPIVYKRFQNNDFYIFAVMEFSEKIHSCVALKNKGIKSAEDLKGKTVGVMKGTSGEFFMNSFLIVNELLPSDLIIVNLTGPEQVEAISAGEIDALFCWEPYGTIAKSSLKTNWIKLDAQKLIPSTWVFIAKKSFVNENPEVLTKFLEAILSGVNFTNKNKSKALALYANVAQVQEEHIQELFFKETFNLSLKQDLLLDLEAQARWIIDFNYVSEDIVPNFLENIYVKAAQDVVPDNVLIIKQ